MENSVTQKKGKETKFRPYLPSIRSFPILLLFSERVVYQLFQRVKNSSRKEMKKKRKAYLFSITIPDNIERKKKVSTIGRRRRSNILFSCPRHHLPKAFSFHINQTLKEKNLKKKESKN